MWRLSSALTLAPFSELSTTTREVASRRRLGGASWLPWRNSAIVRTSGACGLRVSRAWTIGFVVPSFSNPMYEALIRSVGRAAEKHGFEVVLGSEVEGRSAATFAGLLKEGRVDGLLIASGTLRDDFIRAIVEGGPGPVVPVNRRVEGVTSSVIVDDESASRKAVGYLSSHGHKMIGGIFGPAEIDTSVRRKKGFIDGVTRFGLDAVVVERPGWSAEDGYAGTRAIFRERSEVTAIYASTFLMGIGALRGAAEEARPVPSSLSVMCLHDSYLADYLVPPLTTVRLPTEQLGRTAVDFLVERAEGAPERSIMIKGSGEIVERSSTGPAPARS